MIDSLVIAFQSVTSVSESLLRRIDRILTYKFIDQKDYSVSILSLLLLALIVLISTAISKYLRGFVKKRLLTRVELDSGLQFTLLRITHYVIIVVGLLYGMKVGFGADLTSVAVVLGFLSVGIGFGLQYIASDLVSGLILLFERPIRIGDRVRVAETEGQVKSISLRTTTMVTNDNLAIIVPNSELVRHRLINYSYGSPEVRVSVGVGIAYESDLEKASIALLEAAAAADRTCSAAFCPCCQCRAHRRLR